MSLAVIIVRLDRFFVKPALRAFDKWHCFCETAIIQEEADYRFMAEQARREERVLYLEPIKHRAQS